MVKIDIMLAVFLFILSIGNCGSITNQTASTIDPSTFSQKQSGVVYLVSSGVPIGYAIPSQAVLNINHQVGNNSVKYVVTDLQGNFVGNGPVAWNNTAKPNTSEFRSIKGFRKNAQVIKADKLVKNSTASLKNATLLSAESKLVDGGVHFRLWYRDQRGKYTYSATVFSRPLDKTQKLVKVRQQKYILQVSQELRQTQSQVVQAVSQTKGPIPNKTGTTTKNSVTISISKPAAKPINQTASFNKSSVISKANISQVKGNSIISKTSIGQNTSTKSNNSITKVAKSGDNTNSSAKTVGKKQTNLNSLSPLQVNTAATSPAPLPTSIPAPVTTVATLSSDINSSALASSAPLPVSAPVTTSPTPTTTTTPTLTPTATVTVTPTSTVTSPTVIPSIDATTPTSSSLFPISLNITIIPNSPPAPTVPIPASAPTSTPTTTTLPLPLLPLPPPFQAPSPITIPNCLAVSSAGSCTECDDRYYLSAGACVKVSDDCYTYNPYGKCTSCYLGSILIGTGVCRKIH